MMTPDLRAQIDQHLAQIETHLAAVRVLLSVPDPPPDETLLLTVVDAAKLLGVGRTLVFGLIRDGELRSVRIGGRRLIPREAVAEFIGQASKPRRPAR